MTFKSNYNPLKSKEGSLFFLLQWPRVTIAYLGPNLVKKFTQTRDELNLFFVRRSSPRSHANTLRPSWLPQCALEGLWSVMGKRVETTKCLTLNSSQHSVDVAGLLFHFPSATVLPQDLLIDERRGF